MGIIWINGYIKPDTNIILPIYDLIQLLHIVWILPLCPVSYAIEFFVFIFNFHRLLLSLHSTHSFSCTSSFSFLSFIFFLTWLTKCLFKQQIFLNKRSIDFLKCPDTNYFVIGLLLYFFFFSAFFAHVFSSILFHCSSQTNWIHGYC